MLQKGKSNPKILVVLLIILLAAGVFLVYQLKSNIANAQTVIKNKAQVTYKSLAGTSYGPVLSNEVSVTITAAAGNTLNLQYTREGVTNYSESVTVKFYNAGTSQLAGAVTVSTNAAGAGSAAKPTAVVNGQRYDIVLRAPYCLTRKASNILWPPSGAITFNKALAGNLNNTDDIVNTLDWSLMNTSWRTNNAVADINKDSIVNTIDWGVMNKNWRLVGEE